MKRADKIFLIYSLPDNATFSYQSSGRVELLSEYFKIALSAITFRLPELELIPYGSAEMQDITDGLCILLVSDDLLEEMRQSNKFRQFVTRKELIIIGIYIKQHSTSVPDEISKIRFFNLSYIQEMQPGTAASLSPISSVQERNFWHNLINLSYTVVQTKAVSKNPLILITYAGVFDDFVNDLKKLFQQQGYDVHIKDSVSETNQITDLIDSFSIDLPVGHVHLAQCDDKDDYTECEEWLKKLVEEQKSDNPIRLYFYIAKLYETANSSKLKNMLIIGANDEREYLYDQSHKSLQKSIMEDIVAHSGTRGSDKDMRIYFDFERGNSEAAGSLIDQLREGGFNVSSSLFTDDIIAARQLYFENLRESDVIVLYGVETPIRWFEMKLLDIFKAPGFGRTKASPKIIIIKEGDDEFTNHNKQIEIVSINSDHKELYAELAREIH